MLQKLDIIKQGRHPCFILFGKEIVIMDKSEKKKELIRSIKFLLFSVSAGLIEMGSFSLF